MLIIPCSYGSIRVNYTVGLSGEALSTDDKVRSVKDHLLSKATEWTPNEPVFSGFPVNTVKTNTDASKQDILGKSRFMTVYQFNFTHRSGKWLKFLPISDCTCL